MQLVNKAKEGTQIPDALPPSLLPFKIRPSSLPSNGGIIPNIANEIKVFLYKEYIKILFFL
jgi:hypothetical protein